jgi:hypothetical protein
MYLLEMAQKGMKVAGAKMLSADVLIEEDLLGMKQKLITVGSRSGKPDHAGVWDKDLAFVSA